MKQIFVGFADSDKFLAAVNASRPINLSITTKHGQPDKRIGVRMDSGILIPKSLTKRAEEWDAEIKAAGERKVGK